MTTKTEPLAPDLKIVELMPADRAVEALPSAAGTISPLASANAPFLFVDETSFCSSNSGIAGVTLSASRQILLLPDKSVASDRVIIAHLRASLPVMLALRDTINEVERMAKEQAAAALAAIEAEAADPPRMAH